LIWDGYARAMKFGASHITAAVLLVAGYHYADRIASTFNATAQEAHPASCDIKGNISINTGERIYHVPGQEHYDETIIRPEYGERWFCTEAEARAAGWRKARR